MICEAKTKRESVEAMDDSCIGRTATSKEAFEIEPTSLLLLFANAWTAMEALELNCYDGGRTMSILGEC
jgi:hypothetical protein